MNFLFASDSFKGTLTSEETISLLTKAAEEVFPGCTCTGVPVADGGEGTTKAVVSAVGGRLHFVTLHGPLTEIERAYYGMLPGGSAILEMASASGLPLVAPKDRNPLKTTTYGTGELLLAALENGATDIFLAIGGSATNDGGMGFARALGARFLDADGNELSGCGEDLIRVHDIDLSSLHPLAKKAKITVMSDVTNPLCGTNGATRTFGAQKGATPEMIEELENGMQNYRDVIRRSFGVDPDTIPGAGAAGGLGTALSVFLSATMRSGIETVLDLVHFDEKLEGVDLVVTGEGRTDWQSAFGKVMQGVGERAKAHGVPAVALSGSLGPKYEDIYAHGIEGILTTVDAPMPLEDALKNAPDLYEKGAVRLFRTIRAGLLMGKKGGSL